MNKPKILTTVFVIFGTLISGQVYAGDSHQNNLTTKNSFVVPWDVGRDNPLICEVREENTGNYEVQVFSIIDNANSHRKIIYKHKTIDQPISIFPTKDVGGVLITIWESGSGYHIKAFSYSDQKIHEVLNSGSKYMPELVNMENGGIKIIITKTEANKPIKAMIYSWAGKKYVLQNTVSWEDRFVEALK